MILGGPFVPSNEDISAGCYGESRPGDAWLTATHAQRDRWEKKVGGRERIWRDESQEGKDGSVSADNRM